jgi:hypothetical protein
MTRRSEKERLLTDVLGEESEARFQRSLLDETLRLARHRRRLRRTRPVIGVFAVMALIVTVAFWQRPVRPVTKPQPAALNYQLTLSQPLAPSQLISKRPFLAEQVMISQVAVGMIHTTKESGGYREVGDDELLELAPQPAALVRRGPFLVELVFIPTPRNADSHQN